jgi:hypothetical protein
MLTSTNKVQTLFFTLCYLLAQFGSGEIYASPAGADPTATAKNLNLYIVKDLLSHIPIQSTLEIDLDTLVSVQPPDQPVTIELVSPLTLLGFGSFTPLTAENKTTFTLDEESQTGYAKGTLTYQVKYGTTVLATGQITIHYVVFDTPPPGYLALTPGDCFAYMGAVTFTSAYRFITSYTGSTQPEGWTGGKLNLDNRRMVGFSIPYVADLNHDGHPEVIGMGQNDGGTSLYGNFRYVYIYDGRTGKEIARMPFVNSSGSEITADFNTTGGYHVTPSIAALVDSDRNGIIEMIVAFPRADGHADCTLRVVSYNIVPSGNTYTLQYRWRSADRYIRNVAAGTNGDDEFQRANPQVVDLDGDGTPEVLVYNKVYNAANGDLLLELETMGTGTSSSTWPTAYLGCNVNAPGGEVNRDRYQAFPYIYDMDLDGIYDIVAGGRIYRIRKDNLGALPGRPGSGFSADRITMTGVGDGYTGVADINGDGKADVVVVSRAGTSGTSDVVVKVWNPGFDNAGVAHPSLIASRNIELASGGANATGSNSYVYIGDIDGREQSYNGSTYRLPEIAVLTRRVNIGSFPRHPNIAAIPAGDGANQGGIPSSYTLTGEGCIFALTYDVAAGDLKGSFIMEHEDTSINTGFTMFDFDNDGIQEICYRDMQTLRIIKPTIPFVKTSYTNSNYPNVIKFSKSCESYTGFEYPVIADIDNDASAEMVVVGHQNGATAFGYIYAVGNGAGDKFAPALPVWNQFMYDPFKINPDLTTPRRIDGNHAIDRLSPAYTFRREVKDENNSVVKVIEHYNPFNGTLLQMPYFTALRSGAGGSFNFEPVVYLTEAYMINNNDPAEAGRPRITGSSPYYIEISIGNRSTAKTNIPPSTPVKVYWDNRVSKDTRAVEKLLSELKYWNGSAWVDFGTTKFISAGETVRVQIPLPSGDTGESVYIVRLGDDSDFSSATPVWRWGLNDLTEGSPNPSLGIGVASRRFRDCNWDDQTVRAARNQVIDDTQTVQEYHSVVIEIWENDILPDTYFTGNPAIPNDSMKIVAWPKAGALSFSGTGRDSRITYLHADSVPLTQAIDSFRYEVYFLDASRGPATFRRDTATVYIYVLESTTHGFAACYGSETTVALADKPAGVRFDWYTAEDDELLGSGRERTAQFLADSVYRIHPMMPENMMYSYLDFPRGMLTVSMATFSSEHAAMRWTGLIDHNWKNPGNWVEVKEEGYEAPANFAPTGCVDVVIPSGAVNYPELTDSAWCGIITMKDRAMLKNPHVLTYGRAQVECRLTPVEKDSFIMWSAPLKDMYSGDYHFKTGGGNPNWGDSYMMFFQMGNPDNPGVTAVANVMTSTVGHPGVPLPLGTAFNFRLTATSINRDSVFRFPQAAASYTVVRNNVTTTYTLDRAHSGRFITDEVTLTNNVFEFTVANNVSGARFVQVVNPYMAWLDVQKFLAGNSDKLDAGGYVSWNGNVNTGFVSLYASMANDTLRYWVPSFRDQTASGAGQGMIPPLKSFFVKTKASTAASLSLKMSPDYTTTRGTTLSNPYTLRSAAGDTPPLLYIRASQGEKAGSAVLHFDPEASVDYDGKEDVIQLFYEGNSGTGGIPLTVYSLTPRKVPLAINTGGDFTSAGTALGLRVRDPGEVRLDFSGLSSFRHEVYLRDAELNKEIDLQRTPSYTFTVAKAADSRAITLDDRFSLRIRYTGSATGHEAAPELPQWNVSGEYGRIEVQAYSGLIRQLHVYNAAGALVYGTNTRSGRFSIPAEPGIYFVKVRIEDEEKTERVFVK